MPVGPPSISSKQEETETKADEVNKQNGKCSQQLATCGHNNNKNGKSVGSASSGSFGGRRSRSSQFSLDALRGSSMRGGFFSDEEDAEDEQDSRGANGRTRTELLRGRNVVIQACSIEMAEEDFPDRDKNFSKSDKDVAEIIKQINSLVLFQGYEDDELKSVIAYMYRRKVAKGEVVIRQGEEGDALYVVRTGRYECTVKQPDGSEKQIRTYNGSGYFGDLALIHHAPRAATITATSDGELWVLNALRYSWLKQRQAVRNAECFEQSIKRIPMFSNSLTNSHINRLIDAIEVITMHKNDVICRQGEPGDAMYFILDGKVNVMVDKKQVGVLQTNQFFGERALILDEGRAATCVAQTSIKLAKLPKESFEMLIPDQVVASMREYVAKAYTKSVSK